MTYRDDLDALAARHAALETEVARKRRELDEVASMLVEAHRIDKAEAHFARPPAARRRHGRYLVLGALVAMGIGSGAAMSAVAGTTAEASTPRAGAADKMIAVHAWTAAQRAERRKAAYDALQEIGLTAKADAAAKKRAKRAGVPFDQYLFREELASLTGEHKR
jgi:D-serine deaminase-like pyridoxal phosphate-dependent protein